MGSRAININPGTPTRAYEKLAKVLVEAAIRVRLRATMSNSHPPPALDRHYWCFISYCHADNQEEGRQWSSWLHHELETYEVPEELVGKKNAAGEEIPKRIFPVFRDEEELESGNLTEKIYRALDNSKLLVVLCSPRGAQSDYVAQEVGYFKKIGKSDQINAVLLEKEPDESFPETLKYQVDHEGTPVPGQPQEVLAADFRLPDGSQGWTSLEACRQALRDGPEELSRKELARRVDAYGEQLKNAKLKLIAGILCIPLGVLKKRDKAYQLQLARRRVRTLLLWLGAVGLLAAAAVWKTSESTRERDQARHNEGLGWMLRAEVAEREGRVYPDTLFYAARAIGFDGFGKPHDTKKSVLGHLGDWFPFLKREGNFPRLFRSYEDPGQYEKAEDWIFGRTVYLPFWIFAPPGESTVSSVAMSPDSSAFAAGFSDGSIYCWQGFGARADPAVFKGHSKGVTCLAFSPDGRRLASGSIDKSARLWDLSGAAESTVLSGHVLQISRLAFSPDGTSLATASGEGTVILWDAKDGSASATLKGDNTPLYALSFSPDGTAIAAGSESGLLHWWDLNDSNNRRSIRAGGGVVTGAAFHPDGNLLLSSSDQGEIFFWQIPSLERAGTLAGHESWISHLAITPDGTTLASTSGDQTIRLWNLPDNTIEATLTGHTGGVRVAAFSADARSLISGSDDGTVRLWNLAPGLERPDLLGHFEEGAYQFDFSTQEVTAISFARSPEAITRPGSLNPISSFAVLASETSPGEKAWNLYLGVLQARNWTGAGLLFDRLSSDQQVKPHETIDQAAAALGGNIAATVNSAAPSLGFEHLNLAKRLFAEEQLEILARQLGNTWAILDIKPPEGDPLLELLPLDSQRNEARQTARFTLLRRLAQIDNSAALPSLLDSAAAWSQSSNPFFGAEAAGLEKAARLLLDDSDAGNLLPLVLPATEELYRISPKRFETFDYRGRALQAASKWSEAVSIYEEAIHVVPTEFERQEFQRRLEAAKRNLEESAAKPTTVLESREAPADTEPVPQD